MKCDKPNSSRKLGQQPATAPQNKPSRRSFSVRDMLVRGGTLLLAASAGRLPTAAAITPWPSVPAPQPTPPRRPLPHIPAVSGGHGPNTPWTGTWAASPQVSALSFGDETLRQIVHTSIGGNQARLHLSNLFGNATAEIADVYIGQQASGSAVVASTQRRVTFDGVESVAIPAGEVAVSDAIHMPIPALSNMAISLYVPGEVSDATCHTLASQTNYVAEGHKAQDEQLVPSRNFASYCFISNLDVKNEASPGAVVAFGASVTDGYASLTNANQRWPDFLAARLAAAHRPVGVLNQGISGNRLLTDGVGQDAIERLSRDVLTQPHARWFIFSDDPINDLGIAMPPRSAGELIAGLDTLVSRGHAAGLKVLCSTMPPYNGSFYWTPAGEVARGEYNQYVLHGSNRCNAVVDQDRATHDPANPTRYLPIYDSGDHLHPSAAGRQAIANAVPLDALD